jgi:hypothetical protein
MGYGTRDGSWGHRIPTFKPDNTDDTLYIEADWMTVRLDDLLVRVKEYFGEDVNLENITISAEHIHTDCLGYDRYDRGDYTNYIVITLHECKQL